MWRIPKCDQSRGGARCSSQRQFEKSRGPWPGNRSVGRRALFVLFVACLLVETQLLEGAERRGTEVVAKIEKPGTEIRWRGHGGGFREWGCCDGRIWVKSGAGTVDIYTWDKGRLRKDLEVPLPDNADIRLVADDRCVSRFAGDPFKDSALTLTDCRTRRTLNSWSPEVMGWRYWPSGVSANGKYAAVLILGPESFTRNESKLGIVATVREEFTTLGLLEGYAGTAIPSDDGRHIALAPLSTRRGYLVGMYDVKARKVLWLEAVGSLEDVCSCQAACFSPDGKTLYVGSGGGGCVVGLEAKTGKQLFKWYATDSGTARVGVGPPGVACLAMSPDGDYLAAGSESTGKIYVWSKKTANVRRLDHHNEGTVLLVDFDPANSKLATFMFGVLKIWNRNAWSDPDGSNQQTGRNAEMRDSHLFSESGNPGTRTGIGILGKIR